MKAFKFVVSTPVGNLFEAEVVKVSLRGQEGDLAIMANHTPFVTSVKPCICQIELQDKTEKQVDIQRGVLTVSNNSAVLMSGSAKLI